MSSTSNGSSSVKGGGGDAALASASSAVRSTPPPPSASAPLMSASGLPSASSSASKKPRYDSPKQQQQASSNTNGSNLLMHQSQPRPLVALLDGRDCSVEMPILKEIATVAFCDAQSTSEIHDKVLNEAQAALLYSTIALNREDLVKFRALKLIVKIGADLDNIDVKAAADLNIAVCNVGGSCVEEVADSTLSLILSLYRRTHWLASQVEQKLAKQQQQSAPSHHMAAQFIAASTPEQSREVAQGCTRIRGQCLGIVGLGKVGIAVATRARAFGFNICFYDPNVPEGLDKAIGGLTRCQTLGDLMKQSDCVSLHAPLNDSTFHLLNDSAFKQAKPSGLFLVNTAHTSLIDDLALAVAIKSGLVRGAALDKFNADSLHPQTGVLRDCTNVLMITPGVAFYSESSMREMREQAAYEVRRGLVGALKLPVGSGTAATIALLSGLRNCVNRDMLNVPSSSSSSLLGFSNGSAQQNSNPLMMLGNNENRSSLNSTPISGMNRNMSSSQLSALGASSGASSQQLSGSLGNANVSNSLSSSQTRGAGAGSPLINPLMAAMAANSLPNSLAAATNLLTASAASGGVSQNSNAQLLAQLYLKSGGAGLGPVLGGAPGFDQLSAAATAAALNGVSPASILSYLSPLAAAAAATSSSPSSSPNPIASAGSSGAPCSMPNQVPNQTLAAINALMSADPLLQKSALAAATQQQQAAVAALLGSAAAAGVTGSGDGGIKQEVGSPSNGAGGNGTAENGA